MINAESIQKNTKHNDIQPILFLGNILIIVAIKITKIIDTKLSIEGYPEIL